MGFIDRILQEPSYGWANAQGELIKPSVKTLFREAFKNINIFRNRKNWVPFVTWSMAICLLPFLYFFVFEYFSWVTAAVFLLYTMIIMGTHGTIWFHRYCTHKSYTFRHPVFRFITQNLVIKTFPEEVYVVSHHVHHAKSDKPGDPYNPQAGLMYCMLSDVNHQAIAKDLSEDDYRRVSGFMDHSGIWRNNYQQYLKWGSIACPVYTIGLWFFNWGLWYLIFFAIGGHALACTVFASALVWFVGVRAFNYTGHGKGEVKHVDGIDFDRRNLSVNQWRPGLFAGEWHNNHHLYPGSARAGFLPAQLDLPWIYIFLLYKLGAVRWYRCNKKDFIKKYVQGSAEPAA